MQNITEIKALLVRNKLRLYQELSQSKEAMYLIKKSTKTKLNPEEKEKIKVLLIDICKSVPALAVFLLPGGTLLLPLLVKLIPDILPSAFQNDANQEKTST